MSFAEIIMNRYVALGSRAACPAACFDRQTQIHWFINLGFKFLSC
jgi:hypothetical protein